MYLAKPSIHHLSIGPTDVIRGFKTPAELSICSHVTHATSPFFISLVIPHAARRWEIRLTKDSKSFSLPSSGGTFMSLHDRQPTTSPDAVNLGTEARSTSKG